jgi:hypothetical protein
MIVVVYRTTSEFTRAEIGRAVLEASGVVSLTGFSSSQRSFVETLPAFRYGRRFTIADGERWLRELPAALHGSYVWAEARPSPPSAIGPGRESGSGGPSRG